MRTFDVLSASASVLLGFFVAALWLLLALFSSSMSQFEGRDSLNPAWIVLPPFALISACAIFAGGRLNASFQQRHRASWLGIRVAAGLLGAGMAPLSGLVLLSAFQSADAPVVWLYLTLLTVSLLTIGGALRGATPLESNSQA
ncbi:MAG: hypothetical protein ABI577_02330 [bacterium]